MMARFIVRNRERQLPYLKPIDPDPTWRTRCRALLQSPAAPLSEAEAIAHFEHEDGAPPPAENVVEAFRAACAFAESRGELLHDHNEKLTPASRVAIAADGVGPRPSFVRDLIDGQHTPAPMYASPFTATKGAADPGVAALTLDRQEAYSRRLAIVRAKETDPSISWVALGARFGISERMARYFHGEYRRGGEGELRPGQRNCTGLRADEEIVETIDALWKASRTFDRRAIYEHPQLARVRAKVAAAGRNAHVSYDQLCRYVREVLVPNKQFGAMRVGKKRLPSPASFGPVDDLKIIDQALKVIQVDATSVDCHVLDRNGETVLRRVFVLYAIDVGSRCIWAWRVCLTTPTEYDYLRLIHMGIRTKDELVASLGCRPYPVYGVPELILADRGWIFAAQRSRQRLNDIGIAVEHAAPYRPEMKGHVERFIRTINSRFIHRLPGTTKSNPHDKGGRDAEAEARLTVAQFERALSLAIIEGYSDELHTAIGCTPLQQWERLCRN